MNRTSDPAEQAGASPTDPVSGGARNPIRIGGRTLYAISDGFLAMRPEMVGTPDNPTGAYDALALEYGVPRLPLGCFFLPGEHNTLIDTGMGPVDFGGRGTLVGGNLLPALAELGYGPEDIDILGLSHLHADHSGTVADLVTAEPTFPNAQVYLGAGDWDYFIERQLAPVPIGDETTTALRRLNGQGRLHLVEGDLDLAPGVRRLAAPGHTPGHSFYEISDAGERVILLGDAMYCPQQLDNLEWSVSFDVDPALARSTRERYRRDLAENGGGALGCHFPELKVAYVRG